MQFSETQPVANNGRLQYVLDTNVLLHDPTALFRFEEHNINIPLVVLEELDKHKKGVADIARNARQVTRALDTLLQHGSMADGFDLRSASAGQATGRLYFRDSGDFSVKTGEASGLERGKPDNQILACVRALRQRDYDAVLVTRDINLRVKALALGIPAQDYRSDRVLSDEDVLPTGFTVIDESFWEKYADADKGFHRRSGKHFVNVTYPLPVNSFLVEHTSRNRTRLWRVESNTRSGSVLYALQNQNPVDGVPLLNARNEEQQMALNLLHDEDVDFVALLGKAGSGKTLLALAAGLEQVKRGRFSGVMITRATVPLGEEIGFLPGTEEEKMAPWLGGTLQDCFTALGLEDEKNPLRQKVQTSSMAFMRGRSFQGRYIIIDEAQNLTVKQVKALLTRAGDGSKVVVTGNLAQIDTPYLDEGTSGLAWAAKELQDWAHAGHIILPRGVRSRLATYVEEIAGCENQAG
ncbi:TPA: PhoH family protein [Burkholderia vietnamiensis]|nr:PhoH family protein [Burkholderia vietnamiensis]